LSFHISEGKLQSWLPIFIMVRLWGLIFVLKINICHLIKKSESVLPSLGIHFSYYWQKLHLHRQVSFWLWSLCHYVRHQHAL
jgi:hypothetical protein